MTHTLAARQRNDKDLAANEFKIERLQVKIDALTAEMTDLHNERRALKEHR